MTRLLHIYAFGSICRGEIDPGSDIDLLAISSGGSNDLSRSMFSIYSHSKITEIWKEGNPFAWHLHTESRLIFSSDGTDYISLCATPESYSMAQRDCSRFLRIFRRARLSIQSDRASDIFDLSAAFLGLRNFCTCYLLQHNILDFSRGVALNLIGDMQPRDVFAYRLLERARLLCTRGYGSMLTRTEIDEAIRVLPDFEGRMVDFMKDFE